MTSLPSGQPLSRFKLLETRDPDAARESMANIYGELALDPCSRRDPFGLSLAAAPLGRLMINSMRWNAGIEAQSPALVGCFDFCILQHGVGQVHIGRRAVECVGDSGVVMSPVHPLHVRSTEGMIALSVKVPRSVAEAHVRALTGKELGGPLDFAPTMRLDAQMESVWRLVHHIIGEMESNPALTSNSIVSERYSETLLTALLCSQPSNYSQWLQLEAQPAEPRYIRLIEEYLDAHCDQPITATDLARIAGVSASALYAGFKRHRGRAPLEFLRELRLGRVRDALLTAAPGTTVNEIALRWGFNHPGRFSGLYSRRFGESPSQTLKRRAKGH